MHYIDMDNEQLKELCKLRMANDQANVTITRIAVESKANYTPFSVSFIVYSKEWAPYRKNINFNKFYPNEFLYLQAIGVEFEQL